MTDPDYIQLRTEAGTIVGLETASLVIEPLNDSSRNGYIAFANGYGPENTIPWVVEEANFSRTEGVEKQYGFYFEDVVTAGVEPEDFMRYRNTDQQLENDQ